jgi:uncharacterized protein with PIN domain
MRFLFDEMLEKTARWARLFGIDSQIAKGEDSKILDTAISTKRILITRDKQLAERCRKKRAKCILLRSIDVAEQLAEIEFALRRMLFFLPDKNSRCPVCNTKLSVVKKDFIRDIVPPSVYRSHRKFWFCKNCNKAYWEGGHWKNIKRIYKKFKTKEKNYFSNPAEVS